MRCPSKRRAVDGRGFASDIIDDLPYIHYVCHSSRSTRPIFAHPPFQGAPASTNRYGSVGGQGRRITAVAYLRGQLFYVIFTFWVDHRARSSRRRRRHRSPISVTQSHQTPHPPPVISVTQSHQSPSPPPNQKCRSWCRGPERSAAHFFISLGKWAECRRA